MPATDSYDRDTLETAYRAASLYGVYDCDISVLSTKPGISTFAITSASGEKFILKSHPYSERKLAQVESKLRWMRSMSDGGLAVPSPLVAGGDMTRQTLSHGAVPGFLALLSDFVPALERPSRRMYGEYVHELLEWMPGETRWGRDFGWREAQLVGMHTASLHGHAESYNIPDSPDLPGFGWDELLGEKSPLWTEGEAVFDGREMDLLLRASDRLRRTTERLGEEAGSFGPIHRDLTPGNLVFDGHGDVSVVQTVDFDGCGFGYYLFDIAVFLLSVRSLHMRYPKLRRAFLKGYRRVRELPPGLDRLLEDFEVMRHVATLVWELDSRTPADSVKPSAMDFALARISDLLSPDLVTD